jgi:hypothetical protein
MPAPAEPDPTSYHDQRLARRLEDLEFRTAFERQRQKIAAADGETSAYHDQMVMRFGARSYTPQQSALIRDTVRARQPLSAPPLPLNH